MHRDDRRDDLSVQRRLPNLKRAFQVKWSDLADTVERHAPLLGAALRSRDANAECVFAIIASITGTDIGDPAAAAVAIAADPALLEKLRSVEAQSRADLVAYVLRTRENRAAGSRTDKVPARAGLLQSLSITRNTTHRRDDERLRAKYLFMRPLLTAAVLLAAVTMLFVVLFGFADRALHDPTIAATAGCVLMYFMSEARLVTAYWFGATHASKDVDAPDRLPWDAGAHRERAVMTRELEAGIGERDTEERLLQRSAHGEWSTNEQTTVERLV
jgi:hypothetical protein